MKELINRHYTLKKHELVGIGITQQGKRESFMLSYEGEELDIGNAVFEVGSVTKVFTTLLFSHFIRLGKVGLHDKLKTYFPNMKDENITLYQLATHTSSLPREAKNFKPKWQDRHNPFKHFTVEDALLFIENVESKNGKKNPNKATYSNIGMAMLGHALAKLEGKSYEELLHTYVLEPLGMHNTFVTFDETKEILEIKAPLKKNDFFPRIEIYGDAPAGILKSTINDLLLFLEANMGIVESPLYEDMLYAHTLSNPPRLSKTVELGLGWMNFNHDRKKIITHGGTTMGFNTHIGFHQETKQGIVLFDNIHIGTGEILKILATNGTTKIEKLADSLYKKVLN